MNNSIVFMIAMVLCLPLVLGGVLWHAYKKQAGKPAYQPEGKIRWTDSSEDA